MNKETAGLNENLEERGFIYRALYQKSQNLLFYFTSYSLEARGYSYNKQKIIEINGALHAHDLEELTLLGFSFSIDNLEIQFLQPCGWNLRVSTYAKQWVISLACETYMIKAKEPTKPDILTLIIEFKLLKSNIVSRKDPMYFDNDMSILWWWTQYGNFVPLKH